MAGYSQKCIHIKRNLKVLNYRSLQLRCTALNNEYMEINSEHVDVLKSGLNEKAVLNGYT